MTPFAAVVTWSEPYPTSPARLEAALDAVLPCCTEGRRLLSVPGAILAVGLKATTADETLAHGFAVDERQQWAAVGDVTLYERGDVARRLGIGMAGQTDLSLLARTLRQFGPAEVGRIAGDFALVIWDWRTRRLQAIRDHFGVRSLFYRVGKRGIEVAGSVPQLLALAEGEPLIDDVMAYEYLTNTFARPGHTFFADISAVRSAFRLDAGVSMCRQLPYWQPSYQPLAGTYADAVEEWRHRFRTAVRDRIQSHRPVAAYVSGGFDSSSIVGAAHDAMVEGTTPNGRPLALSAIFPGFACDEGEYIQAVLQRCSSFDSFTWDGREPNGDDLDDPLVGAPGLRQGIGRSRKREYEAMRERDSRVLLTGDGGDALGFGYGVLADALVHGRLDTLLRELRGLGSWRRVRAIMRIEAENFLPFERVSPPVAWLGPGLRKEFGKGVAGLARPRGPSHVQANTAAALTKPFAAYAVDMAVGAAAANGLQVRIPYCDLRLVNLVLGMPWHQRLPQGDFRRLHRDGTAPFLPEQVRRRRGKAGFDVMLTHQVRQNLSRITDLLGDRVWLSERYVDQAAARANLQQLLVKDSRLARPAEWRHLWRIVVFEVWLRRVFGYSAEPCVVR